MEKLNALFEGLVFKPNFFSMPQVLNPSSGALL
jgi:hypothetical protein